MRDLETTTPKQEASSALNDNYNTCERGCVHVSKGLSPYLLILALSLIEMK
jgi:hypothetical protein